jgi:hypothetical protein
MRLPAVVGLSRSFWDDARNGMEREKRQFVPRQLTGMSARCRIITLELLGCAISGPHAEWLAGGVLVQCRALVHLDLSKSRIGAGGAESFAGVMGQCAALAHLNLDDNEIGDAGIESFAGVLVQSAALVHLVLGGNVIGPVGEERFTNSFAGMLAQCTALAHLNLSCQRHRNCRGKEASPLRASWRGQASCFLL